VVLYGVGANDCGAGGVSISPHFAVGRDYLWPYQVAYGQRACCSFPSHLELAHASHSACCSCIDPLAPAAHLCHAARPARHGEGHGRRVSLERVLAEIRGVGECTSITRVRVMLRQCRRQALGGQRAMTLMWRVHDPLPSGGDHPLPGRSRHGLRVGQLRSRWLVGSDTLPTGFVNGAQIRNSWGWSGRRDSNPRPIAWEAIQLLFTPSACRGGH
jgi:hypothetical protein